MQLYLIRHPEPLIGKGVCYGVSDIPAKPEALAECLANICPQLTALDNITIYSSPLKRCATLASALLETLPTSPLVICPELAELNFGHWEGLSWDTIYATDAIGLNAWARQAMTYSPGDGESLMQLHQRVMHWFVRICEHKSKKAIVVTHGGPLRVLLSMHKNSPEAVLNTKAPPWGSLSVIEITL